MSFLPTGPLGPGKRNNPMVSPQVQPQFNTPNTGNRQAKLMMKSNANTTNKQQSGFNDKTKPSGKRVGGKTNKGKNKRGERPTPIIPFPKYGDRDNREPSRVRVTPSDFGYDIQGSDQHTSLDDIRDDTTYRDSNQESTIINRVQGGLINRITQITNQFKILDIDVLHCFSCKGYKNAEFNIIDLIRRDITFGTTAAKGALDSLSNLPSYLFAITGGFALLVQLEIAQSWNPPGNTKSDRALSFLSSKMGRAELLEQRTRLREALLCQVLPVKWMKHIIAIYQTYLRSNIDESAKLRFVDRQILKLMSTVLVDGDISEFVAYVDIVVGDISKADKTIPSLMMNKVTSVTFGNCKDYFGEMYNAATYDSDYLSIFNNRQVVWTNGDPTAPGIVNQKFPVSDGDTFYMCSDSSTPFSSLVAMVYRQAASAANDEPGIPLEGANYTVSIDGGVSAFNRFYISENNGVFKMYPVKSLWTDNTDSIHRIDLSGNLTTATGWSMPSGSQQLDVVVASSNAKAAARNSLYAITLN